MAALPSELPVEFSVLTPNLKGRLSRVVLEELSFAARKKLEEAAKCVLLPTPTRSLSRTPTRRDGHATHATHTTVA